MTKVLNRPDAHKVIMSTRGCKVLAENVPACTQIQTDPTAWEVDNKFYFNWIFLAEQLLDGPDHGSSYFPIPLETVLTSPNEKIAPENFQWGRRYKNVGYFYQYPEEPGYGTVYNLSPYYRYTHEHGNNIRSTRSESCLPSLDMVEIWTNMGDDGHTNYYADGMMLVPSQYWNSIKEEDSWYNNCMYNYPKFVWDIIDYQKRFLSATSDLSDKKDRSPYFSEDYYQQQLDIATKGLASCIEAMREDMDPVKMDEVNTD